MIHDLIRHPHTKNPDEEGNRNRLCAEHAHRAGSHQVQNPCRDCPPTSKKESHYADEEGNHNRLCATHAYAAGTVAKPCVGASRIACAAWHRLEKAQGIQLQHVHFVPGQDVPDGTEFRVPGTRYHVDAYDPKTRTIYEYLGNHVHGYPPTHPQFTEDSTFLPGRSNRELYAQTMERLVLIATLGFRVYYLWHHDYVLIQHKPCSHVLDVVQLVVGTRRDLEFSRTNCWISG